MTVAGLRGPGAALSGAGLIGGLAVATTHHGVDAPAAALLVVGVLVAVIVLAGGRHGPATARAVGPDVGGGSYPSVTRWGAATGAAVMVGGLLVALIAHRATTLAVEVVVAGALGSAVVVMPGLVPRIRALLRGVIPVAAVAAVVAVLFATGAGSGAVPGGFGALVGLLVIAVGGAFLVADGLGVTRSPDGGASPWSLITGREGRQTRSTRRAVAGVLLILWSVGVAIALAESAVSENPLSGTLTALGVLAVACLAVGIPLLVTTAARRRREAVERTREAERSRISAHLHDSVLQTLALVQRQSDDPAIVLLARRQETSLRAWMAGEVELAADSLSAQLRAVVTEVEDERQMSIELSVLGDRPAERSDEALVGATREALRNAAVHAPGSPITVYAEVGADVVEVFVSDEGPGFVLDDVPDVRRGIRDSIVGRMSAAGGRAEITTEPGHGTEVLLRVPAS